MEVATTDDADARPPISANMNITAGGLSVEPTAPKIQLAAFDRLTAEALTLSGIDTITLAGFTLAQLHLLGAARSA